MAAYATFNYDDIDDHESKRRRDDSYWKAVEQIKTSVETATLNKISSASEEEDDQGIKLHIRDAHNTIKTNHYKIERFLIDIKKNKCGPGECKELLVYLKEAVNTLIDHFDRETV